MRIALLGDSHGFVPALEAALAACRAATPDVLVFAGDLITNPYSPDPPGESIALLKASGARIVHGNHELLMRAFGTPEWDAAMALRAVRNPGVPPGPWINHMRAGQSAFSAEELAWLRTLPRELRLGRVYVTHGLPGNPFLSVDGMDPREADLTDVRREALTGVDAALILGGHNHLPATLDLHGRRVVRVGATMGWGELVKQEAGYALVTERAGTWEVEHRTVPWAPRDPTWTWARSLEAEP